MTGEFFQALVPPRRVVSGVMRFVDDQKVVLRTLLGTDPTQLLEADEVRVDFRGVKREGPHLRKSSGCDDEPASVAARDCSGDECLSHSYFVAQQGPTEFVDGALDSRNGRQLVRLERDGSKHRLSRVFTQNELCDASANFLRGR